MHSRAYTVLGSIALSLITSEALAVKITSTSVQTGRVEGQSVAVSATVDWEVPTGPANPLERRLVSAAVTTNLGTITSLPAVTKSVSMTLDSTFKYVGQFPDLPIGSYSVTITAARVITNIGRPNTVTSATAPVGISVGAPAGCFSFPNHSLQGFTANGFFNADTTQIVVQQVFNPQWNAFGFFGTTDGSFSLNLNGSQPPLASQTPDSYRYDVISPDLSTNANWQGITGVSFRYFATNGDTANLHAVVRVRNADGTLGLLTQTDPTTGISVTSSALVNIFQTMVDRVTIPAGATVVGTDVRVFMHPGAAATSAVFDVICPRH